MTKHNNKTTEMGKKKERVCTYYVYDTDPYLKIDPTDIRGSIEKAVQGKDRRKIVKYRLPPYDTYIGLFGTYMLFRYRGEYVIATAEDTVYGTEGGK